MPKITAYGPLFRDWEGVSGACAQNATLVPKSETIRPELESILTEARDLKLQQENLEGNRKAVTQRLQQLVQAGRDVARNLRNQVKVELGAKSEHLTQFGVAPIRSRSRKVKSGPVVNPPAAAASTHPTTSTTDTPKPAAPPASKPAG
ncbi:MAG TPA: hypothetical protein VIA62_16430 [Thermoanaerobaculia bacterium]|jgi:hypothetical protein|nr:hypothetical protein [Thermoanaerobaculia bacterium]